MCLFWRQVSAKPIKGLNDACIQYKETSMRYNFIDYTLGHECSCDNPKDQMDEPDWSMSLSRPRHCTYPAALELSSSPGAQPRALDTTRKHSTYASIPSAPPCRYLNFLMSNFRWKEGASMPSEKRGNKKAMSCIPNSRYLIRNRQ